MLLSELLFKQMLCQGPLSVVGEPSQWCSAPQEPASKDVFSGLWGLLTRNWALTVGCLPAFMTLVITLLHVFWGIVFFDGCAKKKWYTLLVVVLSHLLVSALVSIATLLKLGFGA